MLTDVGSKVSHKIARGIVLKESQAFWLDTQCGGMHGRGTEFACRTICLQEEQAQKAGRCSDVRRHQIHEVGNGVSVQADENAGNSAAGS